MSKPDNRFIEEGNVLFRHEAVFIRGTQTPGDWPKTMFPEVCFVGRSNVGKSSLLNALTKQKALARVSKTPGRTQQFNFFNLGDRLMLVDMPGYGYASVGRQLEKMWAEMADNYFKTREQLKRVFVLIDSRNGFKDSDRMLMDWLNRLVVPYQIVLTKVDKTTPADLAALMTELTAEIARNPAATPEILPTSSETGMGVDQLRGIVASLRRSS